MPTGLAASASSQNQVNLTWNASTDNVGVAGYTVYRNGAQLAVVISPGYTDGSVSAPTTYSYTLDAFDFANHHSAQRSPESVTTPAPDTQAPTLPTGLTAPAAGATSVSLAWNASTDNVGVTGYTVYRNGSQLATVSGSTLTYIDLTVAANTSYSYTVDAFHAAQRPRWADRDCTQPDPGQPGLERLHRQRRRHRLHRLSQRQPARHRLRLDPHLHRPDGRRQHQLQLHRRRLPRRPASQVG